MFSTILQKTITVDEHTVSAWTWAMGFLVSSLLGIIIWLAKGIFEKLDNITKQQNISHDDISRIESKLTSVKEDLTDVYEKLKDLPSLVRQVAVVENMLKRIESDISEIKKDTNDHSKRLAELEKQIAVHAQWIKMKGNE